VYKSQDQQESRSRLDAVSGQPQPKPLQILAAYFNRDSTANSSNSQVQLSKKLNKTKLRGLASRMWLALLAGRCTKVCSFCASAGCEATHQSRHLYLAQLSRDCTLCLRTRWIMHRISRQPPALTAVTTMGLRNRVRSRSALKLCPR
jgi:hypothetical protein